MKIDSAVNVTLTFETAEEVARFLRLLELVPLMKTTGDDDKLIESIEKALGKDV